MADFHNITVLGAGVLGSQIAFQSAFKGFDVISYDVSDKAGGLSSCRLRVTRDNPTDAVQQFLGGFRALGEVVRKPG